MKLQLAVKALAALAQESRLEVFRLLVGRGADGMPAGQIAVALDIAPATLSFHLKELHAAELIGQRREGRSIIYALNVGTMRSLLSYLMEDCCQGRPELCEPDYSESACCDGRKGRRKHRRTTAAT